MRPARRSRSLYAARRRSTTGRSPGTTPSARIVGKLRATPPDETFWYFSGRSSNEAGFLLQLFARLYGTNNVNNCSYYCHQASGVGLTSVTGTGTATVALDDLEHADLRVRHRRQPGQQSSAADDAR